MTDQQSTKLFKFVKTTVFCSFKYISTTIMHQHNYLPKAMESLGIDNLALYVRMQQPVKSGMMVKMGQIRCGIKKKVIKKLKGMFPCDLYVRESLKSLVANYAALTYTTSLFTFVAYTTTLFTFVFKMKRTLFTLQKADSLLQISTRTPLRSFLTETWTRRMPTLKKLC